MKFAQHTACGRTQQYHNWAVQGENSQHSFFFFLPHFSKLHLIPYDNHSRSFWYFIFQRLTECPFRNDPNKKIDTGQHHYLAKPGCLQHRPATASSFALQQLFFSSISCTIYCACAVVFPPSCYHCFPSPLQLIFSALSSVRSPFQLHGKVVTKN